MSTVQQIVNTIIYTVNDSTFTNNAGIQKFIVPWMNNAIQKIDLALYTEKSDLVKYFMEPPLTFPANMSSPPARYAKQPLPAGFIGFHEEPWIEGHREPLRVVRDRAQTLRMAREYPVGHPEYYDILPVNMLHIYPTPNVNVNVVGWYFKWTTPVVTANSTFPYGGLFDQIVQDYIVKFYTEASTTRDKAGELMLSGGTKTVEELWAKMVQEVKTFVLLRLGAARPRRTHAKYI
jgi:hypothetical protein